MNFKTWLIIAFTILITVLIMQNSEVVQINILFLSIKMAKFWLISAMLLLGFITGWLVFSGNLISENSKSVYQNIPLEINEEYDENQDYISMKTKKGLSDEDRDYIS